MYTLIVVDDEPIIQMGIRSLLDYKELDIEIVAVASNGEEALRQISLLSPDLVMMDINIPLMNGLEVMEKVNAEDRPSPLFIILSCHDDFAYAQKAVGLGALDYLLKIELTPELLKQSLLKAIQRIEQTKIPTAEDLSLYRGQAALTDNFFMKLLNNWFDTTDAIYEMMTDLSIHFDGSHYVCMYLSHPSASVSSSNLCNLIGGLCKNYGQCYTASWDSDSIALILCISAPDSSDEDIYADVVLPCARHIQNMVYRYQNIRLYTGIGSLADSIDQISPSFQESKTAFRNCNPSEPIVVFSSLCHQKAHPFHIGVIRKELTRALDNYDIITLERILNQIPELILKYIPDTEQSIAICSDIVHFIGISYKGSEHILDDIFVKRESYYSLYKCRTPVQTADWFTAFIGDLCYQVREDFESKKNWLLPSIMKYIEEHYMEPITLTDVSSCFNVSCGYISTIFKKHNGIGFTECVTQAKIRHAKQLLLEPGAKIYDVAAQLGYSDPYYFSKVFKKNTGYSPKEYLTRNNVW